MLIFFSSLVLRLNIGTPAVSTSSPLLSPSPLSWVLSPVTLPTLPSPSRPCLPVFPVAPRGPFSAPVLLPLWPCWTQSKALSRLVFHCTAVWLSNSLSASVSSEGAFALESCHFSGSGSKSSSSLPDGAHPSLWFQPPAACQRLSVSQIPLLFQPLHATVRQAPGPVDCHTRVLPLATLHPHPFLTLGFLSP